MRNKELYDYMYEDDYKYLEEEELTEMKKKINNKKRKVFKRKY